MAALRSSRWLKAFETFAKDLRIKSKEQLSSSEGGVPLKLWGGQKRFLEELGDGLDRGVHSFNCLKSRQLGVTTLSVALVDVFWPAMHPGIIGCLVVDTEKNRELNRAMIEGYIASFPEGYFGDKFSIIRSNRQMLQFSNGSRLDLLVAGTKKKSIAWGEGQGYAFAHLCMAEGTPVITEHGRIKRIEQMVVGDKVLTHTGAKATVVDVCGQPNIKGPMIRIWPWLGAPIYCTDEHTIPTQRGLVEAKDLHKDDWLLMPVRKIKNVYSKDFLTESEAVAHSNTKRAGWIRVASAGAGAEVDLDEEFGFAMGYYLAEGHIILGPTRRPVGIVFARHRDEVAYTDRAVAALRKFIAGAVKTTDKPNSLTTTVAVYSAALASWIDANFGRVENKHIPDDVFDFGEDFCRGLLAGLLCGDGSKTVVTAKTTIRKISDRVTVSGKKHGRPRKGATDPDKLYPLNYVVLPTIHSSIATQARDLAASLGYGWGSIRYEAGGERHGRMCKEQWRVCWSGKAAFNLRGLMGLLQIPMKGIRAEKYEIGGGQVYIKIRSIDSGFEEPMMWDLSVDHDDHTFRTPSIAVGNTELASYGDVEGLRSLEESFAQTNPHRLFVRESTAKGFNHWRTRWKSGQNSLTDRSFFIGWWSGGTNRLEKSDPRFNEYGLQPPTREEREKIARVRDLYEWKITQEQLAWIRWKEVDAGTEQGLLEQNHPWDEEEAFVLTGTSFFQVRTLLNDLKALVENPPIFKGYRYEVDGDFYAFRLIPLDPNIDSVDMVELKVWEEPIEGAKYAIGFDPAYGRNEHKDGSAITVLRCFSDKCIQVAEYRSSQVEPKHAAWVAFHICAAYRDCMINVELEGPGRLVMVEFDYLRQFLGAEMNIQRTEQRGWQDAAANARWFLHHREDSFGAGFAANYQSTARYKEEMLYKLKGSYVCKEIEVKSMALLNEMKNVIIDDRGIIGAPESVEEDKKDDRVFALGLANLAWISWIKKEMIALGQTYEVVMAAERGDTAPATHMLNNLVYRFMARADDPVEKEPTWRELQGLE